jgi:hypothetical protein
MALEGLDARVPAASRFQRTAGGDHEAGVLASPRLVVMLHRFILQRRIR